MRYWKPLLSGFLFSIAWSAIPPYPYTHDLCFAVIAALVFALLFFVQDSVGMHQRLFWLGIATFLCRLIVDLWYWFVNILYPPTLPIIEHFFPIRGVESQIDADISNVFLMFWFLLVAVIYGIPYFKEKFLK